jgi:copper(I)-binding protein
MDRSKMDHDKMDHTDHKMTEGIVISSARVLPPFPGKDTAAGYFKITNHGTADKLISVTSPISGAVEIHNHLEEDGVMKMRRVDGVDLAAGVTVEFRPGSYHLMMFKAELPDTQDEVSLTLNYENAPSVTIIVPVEGRGDDEEDHSGH